MKPLRQTLSSALALAMLGTMISAHGFVVVADLDGDGLHDEQFDAFAGTTIDVGVYASQTPAEINANGGLTGFGLYLFTDGLRIAGDSPNAITIDPTWDFVTQQSVEDPLEAVARVVGNTLTPGGAFNENVHLFDIRVEIPATVGGAFKLTFDDAQNASFVSSQGFVYDDLVVFLTSTINVVPVPDVDGDGVNDLEDNCTVEANPEQVDADGDGIGNRCDADFNQDCTVNAIDLGFFRTRFFTDDPVADLDSSGSVNTVDLGILRSFFFDTPGPSGQPNLCSGS
ncbi:MAG: thrombospondin type 3 repeat-containing protein [Gammaproteobacteria bacterium]